MKKKGFTLIELMVTVTIMMIMTAVVLFNYNQFNDSSLLNAFAYDLSLTIRQAQVYGEAVRESGGSQGAGISVDSVSNFNSTYSVHFDSTAVGSTPPLVLFTCSSSNCSFADSSVVTLQSYTFQRGVKIKELDVTDADNQSISVPTLDITFTRPNPEATIISSGTAYSSARIVLSSTSNSPITKSVVVYSTGQISVQN